MFFAYVGLMIAFFLLGFVVASIFSHAIYAVIRRKNWEAKIPLWLDNIIDFFYL